jgi:hypothetical protein
VRSQDKRKLILITNAYVVEKSIYTRMFEDVSVKIGDYNSEERCIEVLDEIQKLLSPMIVFNNCKCTQDVIENIKEAGACFVTNDAHIEQVSTCVYEMPEK